MLEPLASSTRIPGRDSRLGVPRDPRAGRRQPCDVQPGSLVLDKHVVRTRFRLPAHHEQGVVGAWRWPRRGCTVSVGGGAGAASGERLSGLRGPSAASSVYARAFGITASSVPYVPEVRLLLFSAAALTEHLCQLVLASQLASFAWRDRDAMALHSRAYGTRVDVVLAGTACTRGRRTSPARAPGTLHRACLLGCCDAGRQRVVETRRRSCGSRTKRYDLPRRENSRAAEPSMSSTSDSMVRLAEV